MSGNHLESTSTSQAGLSRDPSLSASDSRHSFDSAEASSGNDMFSPQNNILRADLIVRQDSIDSQNSGPSHSFRKTCNDNQSNHSSIHTRAAESFGASAFKQAEQNSNACMSPPCSNAGSSKGSLETAELTIEELRSGAKMRERYTKMLTHDVEVLKNEMSGQSRSQATLTMELSASQQECNGLKQEIEHLKKSLEETAKKNSVTRDLRLHSTDMDELQKEMEEEIRFHKESNADLTEQLHKTQESNIELLSILQELETIIETQKSEIQNLSQDSKLQIENQFLSAKTQLSTESDTKTQPTQEPGEYSPEAIHNTKLQLQQLQEAQEEQKNVIQMLEKSVEEKDDKIEMERNLKTQAILDSELKWRLQVAAKEEEVTNLEAKLSKAAKYQINRNLEVDTEHETDQAKEINVLRRKVEELEKDCNELTEENLELLLKLKQSTNSTLICETEVSQLQKPQHELRNKETLFEHASTSEKSQAQCPDLERKSRVADIQLQTYKENAVHLEDELQKLHVQVEEQRIELHALQKLIENYEAKEKTEDLQLLLPNVICEPSTPNNLPDILLEIRKLLDHTLKLTKRHGLSLNLSVDCNDICCFHNLELTCNKPLTCKEQLHEILDSLSKTNKCFEGECDRCGVMFKYSKEDTLDTQEEDIKLELESLKKHDNCNSYQGLGNSGEVIQPDLCKEQAEEDIKVVRKQLNTPEDQIASVYEENILLKEKIQSLEREVGSSSKSSEELKKEIIILSSSMESHISASKVLERLSSELGKGKKDLEQHLFDIEKENMQLLERISALEAQLRYLTDEKETCLVKLQNSEAETMKLRDEIKKLEIEMETQKGDMRLNVEDMRNRWLEALEECEYLKKANPKLQLTAENLIDECASLQKFNWDLRRQNTDLHSRCTILESQLKDTQGKFSEFSVKIDTLEAEFLMIVEEVSLKEKTLKSELESLAIEDREQREKVMQENISLNDMYSEKVVEAENLQKELIHLIDQISVAHDKQETVSSEAILEVYVLRAEKAKLEASLKDLTSKYAITQRKLSIMEAEAEAKVQQLTGELTALRNNQDILMTKNDNLLVSQENLKIIEEKQRSVITGLEINLKASKYEELQLAEEISSLKEQLQRANLLQDEVLSLKTSLSEASFENQRVKASFDLLCKDHEDMKTEKDSLVEKINGMQQSLLELDNCQRSKIALEEKILRLEGDLATKEALYAQNAELRFELSKHKRANAELQRKIQHLEEDLEGYLNGVPVHQKPQQLKTTVMHDQLNSVGHADLGTECIDAVCSTKDEKQHLEILGVQSTDYLLKIQSLEIELAEALEANDMYKTQLRRFLSEEQTFSDTSMTAGSHNESDDRRQRNSISFLEVELRDIRERYLQLSLRYAEVEAQREELVLKLKSTNNTKSWFS
uniref:Uncharacterized protein n=3 Tax=Chenopodium quinoa TaxID=63459 RepID=A0A803MUI1_CHEQI